MAQLIRRLTLRERLAALRADTFGPASEEPYRRRARDGVRLVAATVILILLARHVRDVTPTEQSIFEFFNSLPNGMASFFTTLYRLGALWAVALVAGAALLDRRWRLARDLALSGALAWGIARAVGILVVEKAGIAKSLEVITRTGDTPTFPLVRLAIVVAVVAAAAPYVSRPVRRIGGLLVVALALSALYLGTASPNDALAAIVLGWGVAAGVHFAFGSPGGRPTSEQVKGALAQLGIPAKNVRLARHQPTGSTLMLAESDNGPLSIKVIGRDEADAQMVAKVFRYLTYKDSGPTLHLTRLHHVEHEAYTILLARAGGVDAPEVVIAGKAGPSAALLVTRRTKGRLMADVPRASVTDAVLERLWEEVAQLHAARIAHGALNTASVLVTERGPEIIEFGVSTNWTEQRGADDVAELLACTAAIVGEERAVKAAVRGIGTDALDQALPFLQPASLGHRTRELTARNRKGVQQRLERLREVGAGAAGTDPPELQELYRVSPTNLLLAIGTLVAAAALLGQVGSPEAVWETLKNADWAWVVVAFVLSMATNVAFAIALMGTVPMKLPLWPTTEVQIAMGFSNLAIPAVGGTVVQIRFLQKQGVDLASAIASGGLLSTVANIGSQVGLFFLAVSLAPNDVNLGRIPTSGFSEILLGLALLLGVAAAAVLGVRRLRRVVVPPVMRAAMTLWDALRSPRRVALLVGGNVLASLVFALSLLACLEAFGAGDVSFWSLLAVNIGIGTIASLVPVPGGGTAVSSVGLGGALVAFGVSKDAAVAAVLTNQMVVNYLPALPGWFATRRLMKRDYL